KRTNYLSTPLRCAQGNETLSRHWRECHLSQSASSNGIHRRLFQARGARLHSRLGSFVQPSLRCSRRLGQNYKPMSRQFYSLIIPRRLFGGWLILGTLSFLLAIAPLLGEPVPNIRCAPERSPSDEAVI